MTIAISGHNGFIGKELIKSLIDDKHDLILIDRSDYINKENLAKKINKSEVIINLSGFSIQNKWNKKNKQLIIESRINTTSILVDFLNNSDDNNKVFICASACGIYSSKTNIIHDENSTTFENDFLSTVCQKWEEQANKLNSNKHRIINLRLGVVLGKEGGLYKKIKPIINLNLGVFFGNGNQLMPIIHINDLIEIFKFIIINKNITGPVNCVTKNNYSHKSIFEQFAKSLNRFILLRLPSFFVKIIFGENSDLLLKGQNVFPEKLIKNGFAFKYDNLNEIFEDLKEA